jgi:hypothetical protein
MCNLNISVSARLQSTVLNGKNMAKKVKTKCKTFSNINIKHYRIMSVRTRLAALLLLPLAAIKLWAAARPNFPTFQSGLNH